LNKSETLPYAALSAVYDKLGHHDATAWSGYLLGFLKELGILPGGRLIDAACGTGGISVLLAKAGYAVTGMDISPQMLSQAAEKASRMGTAVTFVCQDIRAMKVHRPADGILCCCDGVNYLLTDDDFLNFLRSAHRGLKKGGALLFDISSSQKLLAMDGQFYGEETEDSAYLWSNSVNKAGTVITMDLTLFTQEAGGLFRRSHEVHRQRIWTEEQILQLLSQAGYECRGVYEAFTRDPPGKDCQRVQFCAISV
jgi:SAM-dependent methyltransferase